MAQVDPSAGRLLWLNQSLEMAPPIRRPSLVDLNSNGHEHHHGEKLDSAGKAYHRGCLLIALNDKLLDRLMQRVGGIAAGPLPEGNATRYWRGHSFLDLLMKPVV